MRDIWPHFGKRKDRATTYIKMNQIYFFWLDPSPPIPLSRTKLWVFLKNGSKDLPNFLHDSREQWGAPSNHTRVVVVKYSIKGKIDENDYVTWSIQGIEVSQHYSIQNVQVENYLPWSVKSGLGLIRCNFQVIAFLSWLHKWKYIKV